MKALLLFLAMLPCLLVAGEQPLCTGRELTRYETMKALAEVAPGLDCLPLSSGAYAEVDHSLIMQMLAQYWAFLFKNGIIYSQITGRTGYHARFDCVDFTAGFIFRARLRHRFEGESRTHPAMFSIGYIKDQRARDPRLPPLPQEGHCVALLLTDAGPVFVDPQKGKVVLSAAELKTLYWVGQ